MLPKALATLLISLHLLSPTKPAIANTTNGSQAPVVPQTLSIPDEVYADLALQHELNHISVYYFDDNPANTVSIDSAKNWDPASTIKLYVAMYAFDQANHGKISMGQNVTIDAKNVAASTTYPNGYPPLSEGDTVSVYRLVDQMITQSDNTAYNTLLDLLDRSQVTKYIHDLGFTNSSVGAKLNLSDAQQQTEFSVNGYGPNLITAEDFAKAFIMIRGQRIPGSSDLFNILSRQKLNSMIPEPLPSNVVVAHKTGELDPYYHDGGIVVDSSKKRRYVLSVFSDMGSPNIVAHISDLVYTTDVNIVGKNAEIGKNESEVPNVSLDPLVAENNLQDTSVLAATTLNIKLPKVTASDIGITAQDISGSLDAKQLPPVIIPYDSPFHFLVDIAERFRTATTIVPGIKTTYETQNLQLSLAEANELTKRGENGKANVVLQNVDNKLTQLAQGSVVSTSASLQQQINQISETRFTILGDELKNTANQDEKIKVIKEVASQALNTTQNVKPYIPEAVKQTELTQIPVVGQVVKTTTNSVTIQTPDGNEVTTEVPSQIKTRAVASDSAQIQGPTDLEVGSTIALTSNFALINIASDSAQVKPVTVLKVNKDTNTMVIVGANGVPQQVDLTARTVIKGSDTTISLDQVKPGDVVVVHGDPIPAPSTSTPSGSLASPPASASPSPNSTGAPQSTGQPNIQTPIPTGLPSGSGSGTIKPSPTTTPAPTATGVKTSANPTASPVSTTKPKVTPTPIPTKNPTPTPQVIKGNVIQVVQPAAPISTPIPQKATPVPTATPNIKH